MPLEQVLLAPCVEGGPFRDNVGDYDGTVLALVLIHKLLHARSLQFGYSVPTVWVFSPEAAADTIKEEGFRV